MYDIYSARTLCVLGAVYDIHPSFSVFNSNKVTSVSAIHMHAYKVQWEDQCSKKCPRG